MKTSPYLFIFIFILSGIGLFAQNRVVLVEEGTGTWCSYCPRGMVLGHELSQDYPGKVLLVAAHGNDVMEIPGGGYGDSLAMTAFPSGHFDRVLLNKDPLTWSTHMASRVNVPSPVNVSLTRVYNPLSRILSVTVEASFISTLSGGDYRIGGILVEDGVTGPAPLYSQSNSYSGGAMGPMGGFENLPNPVAASQMEYDHVARALLSDFNGLQASLPANPQAGQTYSHTFTIQLDTAWNEAYVRVYGLVINAGTGEIMNAGTSEYAAGDYNARPFFHCDSTAIGQVSSPFTMPIRCHDPDNDSLTITGTGIPSWLSLQATGPSEAILTGTPATSGQYNFMLQVSDGVKTSEMNVSIMVNAAGGGWVQVGNPGFTSAASKYISPSAIDLLSGKVYCLAVDASDMNYVYQYDGSNWSQVGNPLPGYSLYGTIEVNPVSHEPWIFITTSSGSGKVYSFTNNSWTQVGSTITANSHLQLKFTANGTPVVAYALNGTGIGIKTYDGVNWNTNPNPSSPHLLSWISLKINANDHLFLLVAEFVTNYTPYSRVYEFDGTAWTSLGTLINPNATVSPSSTSLHELAIGSGGEVYVATGHSAGTNVYSWNGAGWDTIAVNIDNGVRDAFDLGIGLNNQLFMVYQNTNNKATCKAWDGNSWSMVGLPDFTPAIKNISMIINGDGYPSVTYVDLDASMGKLSTKRYLDQASSIDQSAVNTPSLLLYPNPVTNTIYINSNFPGRQFYTLYDCAGRVIQKGYIDNKSIDVRGIQAGMYMIFLEGHPKMNKIIKY